MKKKDPVNHIENLKGKVAADATMKSITMGNIAWQKMLIRQKDESQNGCFKKAKYVKFSKKQTFLNPW